MADESKRIIVDDDWKVEAQREKERLAEESEQKAAAAQQRHGPIGFLDLLNLIAMQALVGLGGFAGPGGDPIPPNLETAKHFIDLLQVMDEKTKNNLSQEEKQVLDQTLYELRMRYVQMSTAGAGGPADLPGMGMPRAGR